MIDSVSIATRGLSFIAALQAAGIPLFLWMFGAHLSNALPQIIRFARVAVTAGLVFVIGYELVEPARLAGAWSGIFDWSLHRLLLTSDVGTASVVRTVGLALVGLGLLSRGERAIPADEDESVVVTPARSGDLMPDRIALLEAVSGAALIILSFPLMGHTATHEPRWLLASLLLIHLFIVTFWFGALVPLSQVIRHERADVAALVIEQFSKAAVWLVPLLFFAGLGLALLLLPNLAALMTAYGKLLITKVALFAVLMILAALNKWRLGPAMRAGAAERGGVLRGSIRAEWVLIACVLVVTAVMTALFSPD